MNSISLNTPQKGKVRLIVFRDLEDANWYGVALEFNIVVSGDSFEKTFSELKEAMDGYLEVASEIKGSTKHPYLNQTPMDEYEKLWIELESSDSVSSPYQVEFHGLKNIHA